MGKRKNKKHPPRRNASAPAGGSSLSKGYGGGPSNPSPLELFRYTPNAPVYTAGTANRLNKIRHYRGWVYVAVRAIAEKISQLRPTVGIKRKITDGRSKFLTKGMQERLKATSVIRESEDIEPVEEGHPLSLLLDDPNEPDTSADLWYRTILYWELTGITYWWLPRNNAGMPCEVWVLPSHWVTPIGGVDRIVDHYRITPYEGSFYTCDIDADDVIAIKHPSPLSLVDGWSPLDGGAAWTDQAEAMDAARWFQMANSHNAGLVLQLEGGMDAPSKEDLDAAYTMLAERMRGPSKNRLPLILPPGWKSGGRYGLTSEELDFTLSFDQIRDMVLALFRVPKGVLGIEPGVANTSAYAPNAYFFDQCINPKLQYLSQVLTEKLAKKRFDKSLCIYWHNVAPLNPQEEQIKWDNAIKQGVVTINEYRVDYLNRQPLEGFGDEPLIPSGYVPVPTGETGELPILSSDSQEVREGDEQPVYQSVFRPLAGDNAAKDELASVATTVDGDKTTNVYQIIALQRAFTAGQLQRDAAIETAVAIGGVDRSVAEKLFPLKQPVQLLPKQVGEQPVEPQKKSLAAKCDIKVKLPDVRQERDYSCGASAFQAIAEMYGVGPNEESWYRDALDTDPEEGTPPQNIRELADQLGLQTIVKQNMSDDELKQWMDRGVPVILLIQAWGDPATYSADGNGHYVVAIGYNDDELIVEDPSLRLTRGYIDWSDLNTRWHDSGMNGEKYSRWGMAVLKHEVVRPVKSFSLNGNGKHLHKVGQEWW